MLEAWLAGSGGSAGGGGGRDVRRYLSMSRVEEEIIEGINVEGLVTLRRWGETEGGGGGGGGSRRRPIRPTSLPLISTTCSRPFSSSPPIHPLPHWKYEVSSFYEMKLFHLPDGRSHNGEGGGGTGSGGGDRADEEELGAFWELLDSELRPIQPMRSCPESLSIFSEHKEMARKYLVLQQELFNLRKHKSVLEEKLSQAEKLEQLGNQRYQDKIRELENKRENLRHTHNKLRQQLEQIRMRQEEQQQRQNQQDDGSGDGIGHNLPLSPP